MHSGMNVHFLYNAKYPLSLGHKAEEVEAISDVKKTCKKQLPLQHLITTAELFFWQQYADTVLLTCLADTLSNLETIAFAVGVFPPLPRPPKNK